MLASDVLGIPMDQINLVNSDTDRVPRGAGTMGSRSLQTAGSAIHVASNEVLARAQKIAAHLLEASPDDIVVGEGGVHVAGRARRTRCRGPTSRLRRATRRSCPSGLEPAPLRHELDFDGSDSTYPFGSHVSVVEVDTETGEVTMLRHVAVDDCGRILNPMLVPASSTAASPRALRRRCTSGCSTTTDGNPLTANLDGLRDAVGRRAAAASRCRTPQTDSPRNPLGAKGIGESGTIGSTPAIHNAVVDAVQPPRRHAHRHAVHRRARVARDPGGFGLDQSGGPRPDVSASRCSHTAESAVNNA